MHENRINLLGGSYVNQESLDEETEELKEQIREYKWTYCCIGLYYGVKSFFYVPIQLTLDIFAETKRGESASTELKWMYYSAFIFSLPWFLKPVFAWIVDRLFPFGYRIKSYCLALAVCNILAAGVFIILDFGKAIQIVTLVNVFTSVILDTIAQGMTTLTITMEQRVQFKSNPGLLRKKRDTNGIMNQPDEDDSIWEPTASENFSKYTVSVCGAKYVWIFLSYIIFLGLQRAAGGVEINNGSEDPKMKLIFIFISYFVYLSASLAFIWVIWRFKELKQTHLLNQSPPTTSVVEIITTIVSGRKFIFFVSVLLVLINPLNHELWYWVNFFESEVGQSSYLHDLLIASPVLVGGTLAFILVWIVSKQWRTVFLYGHFSTMVGVQILSAIPFILVANFPKTAVAGKPAIFLYCMLSTFTDSMIMSIANICIVEKYLRHNPAGCEGFYVNLFTSINGLIFGCGKLLQVHLLDSFYRADSIGLRSVEFIYYPIGIAGLSILTYFIFCYLYTPTYQAREEGTMNHWLLIHSNLGPENFKSIVSVNSSTSLENEPAAPEKAKKTIYSSQILN